MTCFVPIDFGEQKEKQEYDEKNKELDEESQNEDSDKQDQYNIYDEKNKKLDENEKSQNEDGDEQDQQDINEKLMDATKKTKNLMKMKKVKMKTVMNKINRTLMKN